MNEMLFLRQIFYDMQQREITECQPNMMLMMKKSKTLGSRIMEELHEKHLYVVVDG